MSNTVTERVRAAIETTKRVLPGYWETTLAQRSLLSGRAVGSVYPGMTVEEIREKKGNRMFCDKFFHLEFFGARVLLDPGQVATDCGRFGVPAEDVARQQARDRGEHHVTILAPPEAQEILAKIAADLREKDPELSKTKAEREARHALQALMDDAEHGIKGHPKVLGFGRAVSADGHTCHFYVVEWPEVQEWRSWFGLGPIQLHLTVAFSHQDLVGVDKGIAALL